MSDMEYYRSPHYQEYLLSSHRREVCPPEDVYAFFNWKGLNNLVDFGSGLGFYFTEFRKWFPHVWIWAAECQQEIIDMILRRKLMEGIEQLTPFHIDQSDHPLLPEWVPVPEIIFASLSLSTFPNPGLAMDGLIRSMKAGGRLFIVDWSKTESGFGPKINEKISMDKMKFLAEEYKLEVTKSGRISEHFYGMEVKASSSFIYGYYDLKEEEDEDSAVFKQ
ncbi:SAM-dependent methyltransferase [Leptospira bandrabouensis]|uniref:SAM-dependent methyltransferase n=1 Tax=Leptospira bandrabouensis TaxID=2484903 RepID=A0A6H3NZU0_9LEPT|nr:SAM-dependent methyltransferase [Leptospira bandrabouensis]MCG6145724.1 class I SAM-dependent methyltransferase [Leptospira bandrabouensis]MCG6153251.1 class I SAM-dependent methyltransferase [Leptospira bandrabouensis]MCG6160733.1 class I SAM-dependent methyltransferase [Leptospira bandrabouensis]MCG6165274.1 class I SAM-dependent methyltransferase [Leptospira bandrabouensis]MCW7458639.1 class I SAM-dependent methyltransferase [Leptospira bandrabouensis]